MANQTQIIFIFVGLLLIAGVCPIPEDGQSADDKLSTDSQLQNKTETQKKNLTEEQSKNATVVQQQNSTAVQQQNSTAVQQQNSTEVQQQNSTAVQQQNSTAVQQQNSTQGSNNTAEPPEVSSNSTNATTETKTSESHDTSLESEEEEEKANKESTRSDIPEDLDTSSEESKDEKTEEKPTTKNEEKTSTKAEEKVKAKNTVKKSEAKKGLCEICRCPSNQNVSSYVVDCVNLTLSSYPDWDDVLNIIPEVVVDFSHNSFHTVLKLYSAPTVVTINMAHNNIDSISPSAFVGLPKLRKLSLASNNLTTIHHSALCGHKDSAESALEILDLSGNLLVNLDDDLFECVTNLRWLNLAGNRIKQIDLLTQSALNTLFSLTALDLSDNGLAQLPNEISHPIDHLHVLNLAKNNFNHVPYVLSTSKALIDLNLSENPIEIFNSSSFINMSTLNSLNISGMASLTRITRGAFQSLVNLTHLYCRDNPKLTYFEAMAFNNETSDKDKFLETVELRNNNISQIMEDIFYKTHVHNLDVRGNPIYCSCHIYWITVKGQIEMDNEIMTKTTCYYPEEMRGKSIIDVDFKDMRCSDFTLLHVKDSSMSSSYVFLLTMVIIVVFLVVGVLVFLIKTQSAKRYRALGKETSVQYTVSHDNNGFESINCDETEEYSRYPSYN